MIRRTLITLTVAVALTACTPFAWHHHGNSTTTTTTQPDVTCQAIGCYTP